MCVCMCVGVCWWEEYKEERGRGQGEQWVTGLLGEVEHVIVQPCVYVCVFGYVYVCVSFSASLLRFLMQPKEMPDPLLTCLLRPQETTCLCLQSL